MDHVQAMCGTAKVYDIGAFIRDYCVKTGRMPDVPREQMTREQLQLLVDVGIELRTEHGDNYCLDKLLGQAAKERPDVALIPNLRRSTEADAVRNRGGYVVRCTRLNANGSIFISTDRDPNSPLETELEFWPADFYIVSKPGQDVLTGEVAVTYYEYLAALESK